jgi:hypothetical protein
MSSSFFFALVFPSVPGDQGDQGRVLAALINQ